MNHEQEVLGLKKDLSDLNTGGIDDVCYASSNQLNALLKKIKDSCTKKREVKG